MFECIFCFKELKNHDALNISECSVDGYFPALDIVKNLFDFLGKIINEETELKYMCSICWSKIESFNKFHTEVSMRYGILEFESCLDGEEETIETIETEEVIEDDPVTFEELIEEDIIEDVNIQEIEEFDQLEEIKSVISVKKEDESDLPIKKSKRATPPPKNPADDEKIRQHAEMFCDLCQKEIYSIAEARGHFRQEHPETDAYLKCCGKKFKQRNRLLDHINVVHYNMTYQCHVCYKTFDSKGYLVRHLIYHNDEKKFLCDHCPKSFQKKFLLRNHLLSVHAIENLSPTIPCPLIGCEKLFVTEARLKHHLNYYHVNKDTFQCQICSKGFKTKASCMEHMKIHSRTFEDRFKCEICGHFISDKKSFRKHMKNHETETLDNTCHYCGKKSPTLNALNKHIKYVHETDRKFECRYCDKGFKRARNLKDHEASMHTMEDLYECSVCLKTFRNHANMLSHRKRAHPEHWQKPFYMQPSKNLA